jgi:hypothetical protein
MSFEEILKSEFGEENVTIDYTSQSTDSTIEITILSKDGKKEFKANGLFISDEYIEIGGRKYTTEDLILALNNAFNKE